ncbi:hypothetical protein G3755_004034 [Salmonella enterica]|nr:hypothetical protein [Salmonella enterica]EAO5523896.1 hypothetical protein [Salmonella enterica subsp. enterica serovar Hvittingfoss]EEK9101855.1 hypothetical protein [Salmonella enterica]EEP0416510.1 hypothetical protein [Salmonella enterica]EFB0170363.1 hypothetical protein [Salmonella enterica]
MTWWVWTWRITRHCQNDFDSSPGWLTSDDALVKGTALLARWFRWQPGEIDRLLMDEFEEYIDEANEQIKREYGDG